MNTKRFLNVLIGLLCLMIVSGCSSQRQEIIDLDKVLNIMQTTLDDLNKTVPVDQGIYSDHNAAGSFAPIPPEKQNGDFNRVFVERFQQNLNNAKISQNQIGVKMPQDGSVEGYIDYNNNFSQDVGEKTIFKVELDVERNRLIATDTQHQYRRSSGYSFAQGMFAGYLLRSMFGSQHRMGISPSRFRNMKMSSNDYRTKRTSGFNKSARSFGGSRSFKGGK